MKPYFVKTPTILTKIYGNYCWSKKNVVKNNKEIYLTFDDGPIPEITPWVLEILKKFNAKATFFCVGHNIAKYPEIFCQILNQKHTIANHTYHHLNGWKTSVDDYLKNIERCTLEIEKHVPNFKNELLFRPPYGKIKKKQAKILQEQGYKIIMWDVLSGDFDKEITQETCYKNVVENVENGSIVVLHDSQKSFKNLQHTLPKILKFFIEKNYVFKSL